EEPCSSGGFADVWRGMHNGVPAFCKEAVFWKRLVHENIVPFLSVSPRHHLFIVSEWMEHGDIMSYLDYFPRADRRQPMIDVASGLDYMHSNGVVHGDLKGVSS
ncbi:kinase-like protein, partial [Punctularia strigosozonata HHB-11173 SS5]|uniref:kinase-like protein n=1 Tax=Punctularia strigosozonata (strain HHB-11173) TaxID=741275 RepID=UPI0004416292